MSLRKGLDQLKAEVDHLNQNFDSLFKDQESL